MRNLIGLFDAICDVYDRQYLKPKADGSTFCNLAVHTIASTAFNYNGFRGMVADEMVDFLQGTSDWSVVSMDVAQFNANNGSLVVAGLNSVDLKQKHGHICVIRPGNLCDSGKWGPVPRCVNIGAVDFIARGQKGVMLNLPVGINEAFVPMPKFWVLRSSL